MEPNDAPGLPADEMNPDDATKPVPEEEQAFPPRDAAYAGDDPVVTGGLIDGVFIVANGANVFAGGAELAGDIANSAGELVSGTVELISDGAESAGDLMEGASSWLEGCSGCAAALLLVFSLMAGTAMAVFR
jgi:hypothetical protein